MWVARELSRLLVRIAVVVLITVCIAELRALVGGGDLWHTWKIMLLLFGCLMLLLGGTGTGSAASRRVNWLPITAARGNLIARWSVPRPEDPRLTPNAVFIGSGIALLALGIFV